jgi:multidrug/hemolysin transport system permease protein
MIPFTIRNLKVFFRDKAAVFFSLMAVFIVIGLYALFLGNVWVSSIGDISGARQLMDSWLVAGLLAVTGVTTTLGAFGTLVDDRAKKINKDFYAAPIKRGSITAGYLLSVFLIGVIMSLVTLVLAEVYVVMNGGDLLPGGTAVKVLGLILLSCLANTAMMGFIVSFFESPNAFAAASTIVGTLVGFLAGIYLPIGQLPQAVQTAVKVFPPSHAAALFRQVVMEEPMAVSFAGVPAPYLDIFNESMGVTYQFGDFAVEPWMSVVFLFLVTAVFFVLALLNMARKKSL